MNSTVTLIKWTAPALLPTALAVFMLLPVSAELPVSTAMPISAQIAVAPVSAQMAVSNAVPVSAQIAVAAVVPVSAQMAVDDYPSTDRAEADASYDEPTVEIVILTPDRLAELVGPIALYPDDLLAIVLPASTYPMEISEAARFLEDYEADPSLKPPEDWDESVTALLNYPEVLRMMYDDIEWTWELGGAVLNQQPDVIAAVESFRDRAYAAGNLKSDDYQTVSNDDGVIEITPANEEVIYVPYYEPQRVVIRQVEPVYYYYARPRPVYYYPYPAGHAFFDGFFWGVTTAYGIGWSNHHLVVRHHSFWSHPYYGHNYFGNYYRRPSVTIYNNWYVNNNRHRSNNRYRDGDYWRPRPNHGNRPPAPGYDRGWRDTTAVDAGVLASQPANVPRPGATDRLRDRNVDLSARREDPQLRRDRDVNARGQNRDGQSSIGGQTANRPAAGQRPADETRLRDRPAIASPDTGRPRDQLRERPGITTAGTQPPAGQTRFRDRPATATTGQTRDQIRFRDRPDRPAAVTRLPRDDSRFRDRPDTTTVVTQRPGGETRFRDRPAATIATTDKPRDRIRFRDRPDTPDVATRPDTQRSNPARNTDRQRTPTASNQPAPTPVRPVAATPSVRKPAPQTTDRTRFSPAREAAPARTVVRPPPTAQREPVRVQPRVPPARQTERSAPPAKPRAVTRPSREVETRQAPARKAKEARTNNQKARPSGKQRKQRK